MSLWSWKNKKNSWCYSYLTLIQIMVITRNFFSELHWSLNVLILKIVYNQVINEISENVSSRKLENWNWLSQPFIHTVIGRTRALRALVLCITVWSRGWGKKFWSSNFLEKIHTYIEVIAFIIRTWTTLDPFKPNVIHFFIAFFTILNTIQAILIKHQKLYTK